MPAVLPLVGVGTIWGWLFQPAGVINAVLTDIGLGSVTHAWLGDSTTAIWAITVPAIWVRTVPLSLLNFQGQFTTNFPALCAGICIALLPILVAYGFLQRWIVSGLTAGAIKG